VLDTTISKQTQIT